MESKKKNGSEEPRGRTGIKRFIFLLRCVSNAGHQGPLFNTGGSPNTGIYNCCPKKKRTAVSHNGN